VPSGDYGAKMDLRLASGDLPEVMTSLEAARPTLGESNTVKAIVGQISMADYRAYIQRLRNMPEFKKAFQEFAAQKKDKFPNG
jgi:hypothetical protein